MVRRFPRYVIRIRIINPATVPEARAWKWEKEGCGKSGIQEIRGIFTDAEDGAQTLEFHHTGSQRAL